MVRKPLDYPLNGTVLSVSPVDRTHGASAQLLAAVVDPSLITEHANHLRMVFHPMGARRYIVHWDEVPRPPTRVRSGLGGRSQSLIRHVFGPAY